MQVRMYLDDLTLCDIPTTPNKVIHKRACDTDYTYSHCWHRADDTAEDVKHKLASNLRDYARPVHGDVALLIGSIRK